MYMCLCLYSHTCSLKVDWPGMLPGRETTTNHHPIETDYNYPGVCVSLCMTAVNLGVSTLHAWCWLCMTAFTRMPVLTVHGCRYMDAAVGCA